MNSASNSMRVWDVPADELCDQHLLGEHAEIHAVWSVIVNDKQGYKHHPEVSRWRGNLPAIALRHDEVAACLSARGFRHASPLDSLPMPDRRMAAVSLLNSVAEQRAILRRKDCPCGTLAGRQSGARCWAEVVQAMRSPRWQSSALPRGERR